MTPLGRPRIAPDIVEEHFDELDALWEQREANLFTPDWTLRHLAAHEARAEVNLDGLRLAEWHGIDLARERLTSAGRSGATAATFVLWESGDAAIRDEVVGQFRAGPAEVRDGIRIALRHLSLGESRVELTDASADGGDVAAAAADVLTFHRLAVTGIDALLTAAGVESLKHALGAAGRSGRLPTDRWIPLMRHADASVRTVALHAAARAGLPNVAVFCREAATTAEDPVAIAFLGVLADPGDIPLLQSALARPELAVAAVAALGAMGLVTAIPVLLDLMADPALGTAAAAAYRRITGARDIEGEKPHPPPPVPEGEDEDESLPPDPAKARSDWERRQTSMTAETRWQGGRPISSGSLPADFDDLTLETRRDVYLRGRCLTAGAIPDLELEAVAARQRAA
jgi:hypothetical protein